MSSQKRTEKQSGEVVENTYLWEKRTENEPENEATDLIENIRGSKNGRQTKPSSYRPPV